MECAPDLMSLSFCLGFFFNQNSTLFFSPEMITNRTINLLSLRKDVHATERDGEFDIRVVAALSKVFFPLLLDFSSS